MERQTDGQTEKGAENNKSYCYMGEGIIKKWSQILMCLALNIQGSLASLLSNLVQKIRWIPSGMSS